MHCSPPPQITFPPCRVKIQNTVRVRGSSFSIGILDLDPAPCMSLLWVTVWAFCMDGVVSFCVLRASPTLSYDGETDVKPILFYSKLGYFNSLFYVLPDTSIYEASSNSSKFPCHGSVIC